MIVAAFERLGSAGDRGRRGFAVNPRRKSVTSRRRSGSAGPFSGLALIYRNAIHRAVSVSSSTPRGICLPLARGANSYARRPWHSFARSLGPSFFRGSSCCACFAWRSRCGCSCLAAVGLSSRSAAGWDLASLFAGSGDTHAKLARLVQRASVESRADAEPLPADEMTTLPAGYPYAAPHA